MMELKGKLSTIGGLMGKLSTSNQLTGTISISRDYDTYNGDYEVTPKAHGVQTLQTTNKLLKDDVVVNEIPYYETSNQTGTTVYIAREVK